MKMFAVKNNYILLCNETDQVLISKMTDEKEHLLQDPDGDNMGTKNNGNRISTSDPDLSAAIRLIKEQSEVLQHLRVKLKEEQSKNSKLESKLDQINSQCENLNSTYKTLVESRNEEIEKLRATMEAQNELQASTIDELRFQMQSLRNKLDMNRNYSSENGQTSPGKITNNPVLAALNDNSPKKLIRQTSQDSCSTSGSNPCLLFRSLSSHRGEITWRLNGFTKKIKKIQSGSYDDPSRSEAFSTGQCGYRLSLWAYLNGRGKGAEKCLSLYVRVVAGEYDPILSWPIKPCYTFMLISQHPDSSKRLDLVRVRDLSVKHGGIARPQKDDKSIIVGFDDFIVHEDIEKKNYLMDDSLFLKCIVEIPQSS